mmetsp:Transcript_43832/g.75729  ORF Transcript_43832/g.75729 Transcript_43832/m.75729 type:complete len:322 (+) Transcript_43832:223-1188(+)
MVLLLMAARGCLYDGGLLCLLKQLGGLLLLLGNNLLRDKLWDLGGHHRGRGCSRGHGRHRLYGHRSRGHHGRWFVIHWRRRPLRPHPLQRFLGHLAQQVLVPQSEHTAHRVAQHSPCRFAHGQPRLLRSRQLRSPWRPVRVEARVLNHALQLLLLNHRLLHGPNHLQRRARRDHWLDLRPLSPGDLGGKVKELESAVNVQHLHRLVVLVYRVPSAAGAAAARDLPVLFQRLRPTALPRPAIPRPVHAGLGAARVVRHLHEPLARLLLAHVAARDVLHEDGKVLAEPGSLLAKERALGNAARVDAAEGNTGLLVVFGVQGIG